MDLIDRFKYIMKLNNLTSSAFADEVGVQRSSMSHILSGRNKPSLEFIQKVLSRFPKVDANWLINGIAGIKSEPSLMEERATAEKSAQKEETTDVTSSIINKTLTPESIKKIVIFYEDGTFEAFLPS